MKIEKIISKRNIDSLMHFTRAENLPSILEHGICPRAALDEGKAIFNDEYRFDNCEDAVCTSIEFPNYKMFYRLRMDNPEADWVVLVISADVMIDFNCAFCEMNAGSKPMYSMPLEERMGSSALQTLFKDVSDGRRRVDLGIPDCLPTNPQAEVLVFATIPTDYITHVVFEDAYTKRKYEKYIPDDIDVVVDQGWFAPRMDYKMW